MLPTIAELQEKYPEPKVSSKCLGRTGYCVGGALTLHLGSKERIPAPTTLAQHIFNNAKNSDPKKRLAILDLCCKVALSNDKGDFELAWACLQDAFDWANGEHDATNNQ